MSGKPAARLGDPTACPVPGHGTNPIAAGSPNVLFDSKPAARMGDASACGGALSGNVIPTVLINGKPADVSTVERAIKSGLAYVTEDRKAKGLILDMNVRENSTLVHLPTRYSVIDRAFEHSYIGQAIENLKIKVADTEESVRRLSGGNQQKVVLARCLMAKPKLLIIDEPTRGIDVGAKNEIYKIMNDFVAKGNAIIMISSELPEVLGMTDRVYVMDKGRIKGEMATADASQETIMKLAVA